ncbi:MAG: metallophosphoesterase, partial [Woeseiaceae bacterium]
PRRACELAYHLAEFGALDGAGPVPWRHSVAIDNLEPGAEYRLAIQQEEDRAAVLVRTPSPDGAHFVVYADVETEPESTGAHVAWPAADNDDRRYPVDQTMGYAANLQEISTRRPEFIAIAGDLVESGGEQRDWDEFWRHNGPVAATTLIVPALGNHDYFGGPGDLGGYGSIGVSRALARYRAYFEREPFYVHEHGPVALIVLDTNNGLPERSLQDTNWYLDNMAPPWQPSSPQYEWLERALAEAQREKAFTFVMFHASPYTSGVHGRPPGVGDDENFSSGLPLRALTPLFLRYGVDAVFNGHDEMYEHSVVAGTEEREAGETAPHSVHYFTVGIAGDGLRGPDPLADNPQRVFLADTDAPERWSDEARAPRARLPVPVDERRRGGRALRAARLRRRRGAGRRACRLTSAGSTQASWSSTCWRSSASACGSGAAGRPRIATSSATAPCRGVPCCCRLSRPKPAPSPS